MVFLSKNLSRLTPFFWGGCALVLLCRNGTLLSQGTKLHADEATSVQVGLGVHAGSYSYITLPMAASSQSRIDGSIPSSNQKRAHNGLGLGLKIRHHYEMPKIAVLESDFRSVLIAPMLGGSSTNSHGYRTIELASKLKSRPISILGFNTAGSAGVQFSRYGYTLYSFGHYIDSYGIPIGFSIESKTGQWDIETKYLYGISSSLTYASLLGTNKSQLKTHNLFSQHISILGSYFVNSNVKWQLGIDYHHAYVGIPTNAYQSFGLTSEPLEDNIQVFDLQTFLVSFGLIKSF